jgi:formimidoylglutamate deiminase
VLEVGCPADFFAVNLDDPSVAGADTNSLLTQVVFSCGRAAISDVYVGAKHVIQDRRHFLQNEIVQKFDAVQKRIWGPIQ